MRTRKKITINAMIMPPVVTHVSTTWNVYDAKNELVLTETGNEETLMAYELPIDLDATSFYVVEAIVKLSDDTEVATTKVKIIKDTILITDTVALPPQIHFELLKDARYKLSIKDPTFIGGVDEWMSTDWEVTSSAGVTLFKVEDSIANKDFITIPDSQLSEYDFVVFKARYNLRQNSSSKWGTFDYTRKHSDTQITLDNIQFYRGRTNTYRLLHAKPRNYLFNYVVRLNDFNVKDGIASPTSNIIIPSDFTLGVDKAEIILNDHNFAGSYSTTIKLDLVGVDPEVEDYDMTSGKKELTHNNIDVAEALGIYSGVSRESPIYKNLKSLQMQGFNRVFDNTFRLAYYDVISSTLSVMKVGTTVEELSVRLAPIEDVFSNFSTHYMGHNQIGLFYRIEDGTAKFITYDMSDNYAEMRESIVINPISNVVSMKRKAYWIEENKVHSYHIHGDRAIVNELDDEIVVNENTKLAMKSDDEFYIFNNDGTLWHVDGDTKRRGKFFQSPVAAFNVVNVNNSIVIAAQYDGDIHLINFEDDTPKYLYLIRSTTITNIGLLTDHYNRHITVVKG